jgi:hypothetical protein
MSFLARFVTIVLAIGAFTMNGSLQTDCGDGYTAPLWLTLLLQSVGVLSLLAFAALNIAAGRKYEREGN